MLSASGMITAPIGDIGAPQRYIATASVPSIRLNWSIPRFDRSDGSYGASIEGGRLSRRESSSASLPGGRQSYRGGTNHAGEPAISVRASRLNTAATNARSLRVSAIQRPDSRSEFDRGAAAPEPEEWS